MIYLDNAATTWPKPRKVVEAVTDCMKNFGANPGRSGHRMAIESAEKVYECRELVAELFNLPCSENVIFTHNATHALNIVINGVLNPGDHAICTCMDHNSVLRPLYALSDKISYSILDANLEGKIDISKLKSLIKPETKLVVMTHVSNVCGTIMPVREVSQICRERGILFLLDASQSAGILSIDMQKDNIDYLACPGHKSLYGPMGTGILCINSEFVPNPLTTGGTGSLSSNLSQPELLPDRLESGTLNLPGICGLIEGIRFIKNHGIENIRRYESGLTGHLLSGLSSIKDIKIAGIESSEGRTGVVSFYHTRRDCVEISQYLNSEYDIATRSMYHCAYLAHKALGTEKSGTVRVSPGVFNTKAHIDTLLHALSKL